LVVYPTLSVSAATGDEGDDCVGGVAVVVLPSSVVDRRGARIGMTGGDLDVSQRDTSVEGGHDERGSQHVGVDAVESGSVADRTDPAVGGTSVGSAAIGTEADWAVGPFPDGEVQNAGSSGNQWDTGALVALADDGQGTVATFEAEVLDVRPAGFADA
jgi:hypothetical protein